MAVTLGVMDSGLAAPRRPGTDLTALVPRKGFEPPTHALRMS